MHHRPRPIILALVGVLALTVLATAGCQKPIQPTDGIVQLEIAAEAGADDDAKTRNIAVEMAPSNELVVRLGAHAGTGYAWELAGPAPAVLDTLGAAAVAADDSARVGANNWTTFRFRAIAQGDGIVRFVLRRSWEPAMEHARLVDVSVTVKPTT